MSTPVYAIPRNGRPRPGAERLPKVELPGAEPPGITIAPDDSIRIARDPFAAPAIYYHLTAETLLVATEPAALLDHPSVSRDLDPATVARFLAFRFDADPRTFFRQITELPPGHRLTVTADRVSVERFGRFDPAPRRSGLTITDAARELRHHLTEAVAREIGDRDPNRVAISLSSGLDSGAVAAVAPRGVRAFSWIFDKTPDADERQGVAAVARHLSLPVTWVPGDGAEPLGNGFVPRFVDRSSPFVNPFAALKARLYRAARDAGCEQVLVGDGGDVLYAAREYWLRELVADGRPGSLRSLARTLGAAARGDSFARLALRRLLPRSPIPGGRRRKPAWLTAAGRAALPPATLSPLLPPGRDPVRAELSIGAKHQVLETEERRLFDRCGVLRGNPFWSPALLQWALSLPAYLLHRDGRDKLLTRRALRGLLPEEVLPTGRNGLLGGFFLRGLRARRDAVRELLLERPFSDWARYVRRDRIEPYLDDLERVRFGHTILWRVLCYELWLRRLDGCTPEWDG